MQVRQIKIKNFRGIRSGVINLAGNALLVGGNSVGKSTVCEALDLVLGPERMFRRPVIDEYDFYGTKYQSTGAEDHLPEIRIDVIITKLSVIAQRRFRGRMRRWDGKKGALVAPAADGSTLDEGEWCLPVIFLGRFNPAEDDFDGHTYFAHPHEEPDDLTTEPSGLGAGLRPFTREDKRLCGFLYLRAIRTGNRALSFGRGSLIDTIVRLESEKAGALLETVLGDLAGVTLAENNKGLQHIRTQLRARIEQFLPLASTDAPIDVKTSDLTREHVRDVMRMYVAGQPGSHLIPFNRLSTGTLNVLVYALLTYIAELSDETNVIFAMEEPEIALPPHTQRRLVDFVTSQMGQAIVTSHSPYVIEKFEPDQIVALRRDDDGNLSSSAVVLPPSFKMKRYRDNRRQFAEAVLARGVIVVEGATEAVVIAMAADILDDDPTVEYEHPDIAGISIFDAQGDSSVPLYAPLFAGMRKATFGFHDKPKVEFTADQHSQTAHFDVYRPTTYLGIEDLLSTEPPMNVIDAFLDSVAARDDNPKPGVDVTTLDEEGRRALARNLLIARKGSADGYAAVLMSHCKTSTDVPETISTFLQDVDSTLRGLASSAGAAIDTDEDATQSNGTAASPQPEN